MESEKPFLLHAEPVFPVTDIEQTINFWHEVIGFPNKWMWGTPPVHGGVSWNFAASIQFSLNPKLAESSKGIHIWVRVKHVEALYKQHLEKNIVVEELNNKPWGQKEYIVKENNGFYAVFSEPSGETKQGLTVMPETIRIVEKPPSAARYIELVKSVGWAFDPMVDPEIQFNAAVFSVSAIDTLTHEVIGCAFLLGDDKTVYYVKDVIVHPDYQLKRVGSSLMRKIEEYLKTKGAKHATAGLYTGEGLIPFYRQFGFNHMPGAMYMTVKR
jgi:GNAT superfamily N-acetyltransferase